MLLASLAPRREWQLQGVVEALRLLESFCARNKLRQRDSKRLGKLEEVLVARISQPQLDSADVRPMQACNLPQPLLG